MNAVIRRYSKGLPAADRLALQQAWDVLEAEIRKLYEGGGGVSSLPVYGHVAVEFIRLMREQRIPTAKERTSLSFIKTTGGESNGSSPISKGV